MQRAEQVNQLLPNTVQQIWVANGTYYPSSTGFVLPPKVRIYGGFPSNAQDGVDDLSNRPVGGSSIGQTILSGDMYHSITLPTGGSSLIYTNYHVVVVTKQDSYLDGFIVTQGHAQGAGSGVLVTQNMGGGVLAAENAVLCNLEIRENTGQYGGGMAVVGGSPHIENVYINQNTTQQHGGGIVIVRGSPRFKNIYINRNITQQQGGGIAILGGSPYFENIHINQDTAQQQGGGIAILGGSPYFENIHISNCHSRNGGGVAVLGGCPHFEIAHIFCNSAQFGGGFFAKETNLYAKYLNVYNNIAFHRGGGIFCNEGIMPIFENIRIHHNHAISDGGGGICNEGSMPLFLNALIYNNHGMHGGTIWSQSPIIFIHATIVQNAQPQPDEIMNIGTVYAYNSLICLDGIQQPNGVDNIIDDFTNCPTYFINHLNGYYSLKDTFLTRPITNVHDIVHNILPSVFDTISCCFHFTSGLLQTDLAGNPRITNGMSNYGAYEYGSCPHWKSMNYSEEETEAQKPPIAKEIASGKLQIYPNPTTGKITIRNEESEVRNVEIYDIYGKLLYTSPQPSPKERENSPSFGGGWGEVDISHLATGMYFLKVDGKVFKVIKQ